MQRSTSVSSRVSRVTNNYSIQKFKKPFQFYHKVIRSKLWERLAKLGKDPYDWSKPGKLAKMNVSVAAISTIQAPKHTKVSVAQLVAVCGEETIHTELFR